MKSVPFSRCIDEFEGTNIGKEHEWNRGRDPVQAWHRPSWDSFGGTSGVLRHLRLIVILSWVTDDSIIL